MTAQRSAHEAAHELIDASASAQRLSLAVERLPVGVAAFDTDGAVVFANSVAGRYVAARHGEAVVELRIRALIDAVVTSGEEHEEEIEVHTAGRMVLHLNAIPVLEAGDIAALIVIEDRTRQHRVDDIRRDFVANVSHELKTPLGALSVLAETLEGETDQEVRERLTRRISEEANRMGRLIEDILDLSKVEADQFRPTPVALDEVIRSALSRARPAAAEAGVELHQVLPDTEVKLMGDLGQLESAVGNLIDNAIKYTGSDAQSGGSVTVGLEIAGDDVTLRVADEGIGIAREHLDRIFERFYRVDRGRSRSTGGTGLGLAIVRHVALNHGGSVAVESIQGEGSTFVMTLPYDRSL